MHDLYINFLYQSIRTGIIFLMPSSNGHTYTVRC